mgnify:CR=1 FL=1
MGFCKPGDPCWNYQLGNVDAARILEWQQKGLELAEQCGIDVAPFSSNLCDAVNACVTGSTGSVSACTVSRDIINPCTTGTTFTGSVRALRMGVGTSTYPNEKLTVVGAISATSQLYFSEIVGGTF